MKNFKLFLKISLIISLFSGISYSQGTGSVKGKIFDEDGKPIYGANVFINSGGQTVWNSTDTDGSFTLKPLTPGTYNINVSCVGFSKIMIPNVYVKPDKITYLESTRMPETIMTTGEDAIVVGTKTKLIDPEAPSKMSMLGPELEKLPGSRDLTKVLSSFGTDIQVGDNNKDIIIRGSRPGSSSYFIDGVKVDGLDGIPGTGIASMTVYTGGIPSKYGDITGGIVVIESKSYFDYLNEYKARMRAEEELKKENEMEKQKEKYIIIE